MSGEFQGTVAKGDPQWQDWAEGMAREYFDVVATGMRQHERSAQKMIGPSEIGVPCIRALVYKLAQQEEPGKDKLAWKPQMGTFGHSGMEGFFTTVTTPAGTGPESWEVEQRVDVGLIGPDKLSGSTDLYNKAGCVFDHKFVGDYKLKLVKANNHPGDQYRIQAHSYGRGWALEGWPVHIVMIAFHPRDGELTDSYYWWEVYNEQIALDALARANQTYQTLQAFGLEQTLSMIPLCADRWCRWCRRDEAAAAAVQSPFQRFTA